MMGRTPSYKKQGIQTQNKKLEVFKLITFQWEIRRYILWKFFLLLFWVFFCGGGDSGVLFLEDKMKNNSKYNSIWSSPLGNTVTAKIHEKNFSIYPQLSKQSKSVSYEMVIGLVRFSELQ